MDGRQSHAKRADPAHRTCYCIRNVVQLEIEKYITVAAANAFDNRRAFSREELAADLVEPAAVAEPRDHRERGCGVGEIEGHDRNHATEGQVAHAGHSSEPIKSPMLSIRCDPHHPANTFTTRSGA